MSVTIDQMNFEQLVEREVSSCLADVVVAISETAKDWDRFKWRCSGDTAETYLAHLRATRWWRWDDDAIIPDWGSLTSAIGSPSGPEVLSYHYDKCVKEKKIEEEEHIYRKEGPVFSGSCCENCGENHIDVLDRGEGRVDSLSVHAPFIQSWAMLSGRRPQECRPSIMCQSCIMEEDDPDIVYDGYGERCSACGISNFLCCDEDIVDDQFIYHNYRDVGLCGFCQSCEDSLSEGEKEEKLYDRRASLSIPDHSVSISSSLAITASAARVLEYPDSDDDLVLTDDEGLSEEEYENEDLPENNSEKAKEIKDAVREAGEKVFDLQDDLREGDYLELMNLLQAITNRVNTL